MKDLILFATVLIGCFASSTASAQKGNNQLQLSAQLNLPLGKLADVAHTGGGLAAKGLYGFGSRPQQLTLEVGCHFFGLKDLPPEVDASYSSIPIYAGYRYNFNRFSIEPQAGVSINEVFAVTIGQDASASRLDFGWALGFGYEFKRIELDLRYHNSIQDMSEGANETISFVGLRLGYNFSL